MNTARRRGEIIGWVVSAVALVAGFVLILVGIATPPSASFGWFAYAPLSNYAYVAGAPGLAVAPVTAVGFTLFVVGLVGVAFLVGIRVGARRRA
ncbi:hypothetical protein [Microbacterium aurantiacum]|uniref:Uncharacterized protein n=1 Tax=Microbacterium aurantiacum TaxID=162393 RepID=A0ABT8FUZ8_9MICO|nr:hypothetical protein [Microbacterium aurantiacum]MDN4465143.1 hypothetical protein [Microbacterium aurantiacum]